MDWVGPGRAILIAGPTASGKSALALTLAERMGGIIVNTDSMQVYHDLHIITARPSPEEEARVPHRLYGHVDGAINYSVARYLEDAAAVLTDLESGRVPIFVGGTGLYFKALLGGLSPVPAVPEELRRRIRNEAEGVETADLHRWLAERDAGAAAAVRPTDRLRILRALEVLEATGRALATFHGERMAGPLAGMPAIKVFLTPDRAALRERIDSRFRSMIDAGALEEVARLDARRLDPLLPVMRAHGVPRLREALAGTSSLEEAIARAQAETRQYAKRQVTFFRHQLPEFLPVVPELAEETILNSSREIYGNGA
ncbi:tRNA (adenosine(37)-N6)-dimethylallyltransferase MiaA [Microvirga massiliensis]|uniref:tRNA (adenosine(37)-N6)-dimethylallyltransferase MiaA n=1 Tax=Microvirga massiliensis TaxID=1033741 RepID=UPI00062B5436|nr:tRNA (adenosine(37)-N6)-dimethylallyltransferase MiaA [Microvirga massiliensis]